MTNSPYVRASLAQAALKLVPPLIRGTLLDQSAFREEYGFKTEAVISFGTSGLSMQRSELFDAVRAVLAGTQEADLTDVDGRAWTLRNEAGDDGQPILVVASGEQRLILPNFAVLSQDRDIRLRSLEQAANDMNLPVSAQEEWRSVLGERALEDDEVDSFYSDIRDTPLHLTRSIRDDIKAGQSSVSSLVPFSRRYFERLVGAYDGSVSIRDYAAGAGRDFIRHLLDWRPYEGFMFSLFLSSHAALTAEIDVDRLDSHDLVKAFDFIEKHGDILSRLGAIEVGLRVLADRPEVESYVLPVVRRIRDDDVDGPASECKLFAALFVLVDGELSRTRLFSAEPPFYRRLASSAQAALIHRQLVECGIDHEHFAEWAFNNRAEPYYMQSLADMRTEPRWNPDLAAASQMKADFFGRIMIAARNFERGIGAGELHDLVLGNQPDSLPALIEFPRPYFPGPLEGSEVNPNDLPDDLAQVIEAKLAMDEVEPSSFFALVNSAMVFRVDSGQADLAAKALRLANYRLANVEDQSQLVAILNGLATVAAVSRNPALADELRILVRRYRYDAQYGFSTEEAMRICLVASASCEDLMKWREYAGEWLTELAFDEFQGDEGAILHSHLQSLLHAVPELWVSCARADAALKAYCSR